ncbi:MAG: WD40 repeat domain-containing protein [Actinomycetota bacterium]|nr:WD40 repeat domain-containing protein [Actinomycetota bacterium]
MAAVGLGAAVALTGDEHPGGSSPQNTRRLLPQVSQSLRDNPRRAALTALAADDTGTGGMFAMLDVALAHTTVERVIAAHKGPATGAVRTKETVVTAGADGFVRTWDPATGAKRGEHRVATDVVELAASPLVASVASVDEDGGLALWDVEGDGSPRPQVLEPRAPSDSPVIGLAFSATGTELLVVRRNGRVGRFDAAAGTPLAPKRLVDAEGRLPWSDGDEVELAGVDAVGDEYTAKTTLVVVTTGGDVARINLEALSGRTVVTGDEVPGTPSGIAAQHYGQPSVVVAASGGFMRWDDEVDTATRDRGVAAKDVAISEQRIWLSNVQGVSSIDLAEDSAGRQRTQGRPATGVTEGPGGAVAMHDDGSVSLLSERMQDLSIEPGETSHIANMGPSGALLTAQGFDPNHVDALVAVRPGEKGRDAEGAPVAHRPVRTYRPAPSWWPQGDDDEDDWYVNEAIMGRDLVAAAGQDPLGTAVVLTWDAATGEPVERLPLTTGGVEGTEPALATSVALLEKKKLLAAYSAIQEAIVLWSTEDWKQVATVDVGPAGGFSVRPDEEMIVVAGLSDEQADAAADQPRSRLVFVDVDDHDIDHEVITESTHRAEYAPDGSAIATLGDGGDLRLLSPDGRRQARRTIKLDDDFPLEVAWRPDSDLLAVGVSAGETIFVDPKTGRTSAGIESRGTPTSLSWSADGRLLAVSDRVSDDEGNPEAAPPSLVRLDRLRDRMCAISGRDITPQEWRQWAGEEGPAPDLCPSPRGSGAPPEPIKEPAVAFQSDEGLFVADAAGRRMSIGTYAEDAFPGIPFVWSDGGSLAWTMDGAAHRLRPGQSRPDSWPCACTGVAFDGEDLVAITRNGKALLTFSDPDAAPERTAVAGLPPYGPSTLAYADGRTSVAAYETQQDRSTPSVVFTIGQDGRARRTASEATGSIAGRRATSPDGDSAAFSASLSGGVCYSPVFVGVVDMASGDVDYPDMPGDDDDVPIVRSMGYSESGDLHAMIALNACVDGVAADAPPAGELFRLEDGEWVRTGERGYDIQLGRGVTAVVEQPRTSESVGGRLLLQPEGKPDVVISDAARSVVVRP